MSSFYTSDAAFKRREAFARRLREMGMKDETAYGNVDGETVHNIPAQAVKGRAGTNGKTFSGYIDFEKGCMRLDCAEAPDFWIEVDLSKIPAFGLAPGGRDATMVEEHFKDQVKVAEDHTRKATDVFHT